MRSIRFFLLLAFNALVLLEAYRFNDETDRQALLEFKSQISEEKRVVLSSWNNSFPLCNWKGITCGRKHKRVTGLELEGLQLDGIISQSIGNFSFLKVLDLSNNSFGGTISPQVGNLFRLKRLDLSTNNLGGEIPTGLSNCSRLLQLLLFSNKLGGKVPSELGSTTKLVILHLQSNKLTGKFPPSIGNLTSLKYLNFGINKMEGEIPGGIAKLSRLESCIFSINNFLGVFPPAIYNFSSLEYLSIWNNKFSGSLRSDFGNLLPKLQICQIGENNLIGGIPTTLSNISTLQIFNMEANNFTGSISPNLGKLWNLQRLDLQRNSLGSYSSDDLKFLGALTNCTLLKVLVVGENRFGGELPISVANLSVSLNFLGFNDNLISGGIPLDIGNLISLQRLYLHRNMLTGQLPTTLGKLSYLGKLNLQSNRFSGEIPSFIGNITQLIDFDLSNNSFEGILPSTIGNCRVLLEFMIGANHLNGTIPLEIFKIPSLIVLNLSHNFFTSYLPKDLEQLQNLQRLDVSYNKLSGELPKSLGTCFSLQQISLNENSFDGAIPDISKLVGLREVNLSNNILSGHIPEYFANLSLLEYLNVSNNNLEGRVPTKGVFQNASKVSLFGNNDLCGGIKDFQLRPCRPPPMEKRSHSHLRMIMIRVSLGIALLLLLFIASVSLGWFKKRKENQNTNNPAPSTLEVFHEMISYGVIRTATDGFSLNNLIGSGSFGTVFKAFLPMEDRIVAVKVLNMKRSGAMKSFMAECESLKDIRHRNLVKLLTACSSIDFQGNEFRALIYEFMPNGSLDVWLHPKEVEEIHRPSRALTLFERLNIAIDVASVLEYLHVHCYEPIAHCDLKPSNVLLDNDFIAHVSDFGLARFLLKVDQESYFNQLSTAGIRGTTGYVAPEYGMGGQPSTHGDMYSFGILILEMFTGKRPTNEVFGGNFTLHNYTKSAIPERVLDIADKSILQVGLRVGFPVAECLTQVLEVGLWCCEETPTNRLATSEAIKELISIKERFFKARRTYRH